MKTFTTSGTGNQQTLSPIETDKIPVYDSVTDAEADLANLAENQIIATHDTGSELSAPVDVVQSGNMHAVSSNAVAESLSYSTTEQATGGKWIDGKPIYKKVLIVPTTIIADGNSYKSLGVGYPDNADTMFPPTIFNFSTNTFYYNSYKPIQVASSISGGTTINAGTEIIIEYTKTTD